MAVSFLYLFLAGRKNSFPESDIFKSTYPVSVSIILHHDLSNGSIANLKQSKARTRVTGAKIFSKTVSARMLPRVLRKNKAMSTQRITLVVFSIPGSWTHPYRINTVFRQIRITPNETHSNRNNSSLVSICPPHRNSTGA